jgi:hypothetical protein
MPISSQIANGKIRYSPCQNVSRETLATCKDMTCTLHVVVVLVKDPCFLVNFCLVRLEGRFLEVGDELRSKTAAV